MLLRKKKRHHQKVYPSTPGMHSSYIDQFPHMLRLYIQYVKDMEADENCGFRAIADLVGLRVDN